MINIEIATEMLKELSEESQISAFNFIQYLWDNDKKRKAERAQDSDENLIRDLAEFRKKHMRT